jgi:subtilase family serine protease
VVAVSNSYGSNEFSGETTGAYASTYLPASGHPVVFTVSSGDSGYGAEYPSSLASVISVGGTSLSGGPGSWTETAWSGAGSGCSAYVAKPGFQASSSACSRRRTADISAVANPSTGVLVYTTGSSTGWYAFGGTSVAAPIIAATYAHNPGTSTTAAPLYASQPNKPANFYDVVSGSNGRCTNKRTSATAVLCNAGTGWDGPTGWGTPRAGTIPR